MPPLFFPKLKSTPSLFPGLTSTPSSTTDVTLGIYSYFKYRELLKNLLTNSSGCSIIKLRGGYPPRLYFKVKLSCV